MSQPRPEHFSNTSLKDIPAWWWDLALDGTFWRIDLHEWPIRIDYFRTLSYRKATQRDLCCKTSHSPSRDFQGLYVQSFAPGLRPSGQGMHTWLPHWNHTTLAAFAESWHNERAARTRLSQAQLEAEQLTKWSAQHQEREAARQERWGEWPWERGAREQAGKAAALEQQRIEVAAAHAAHAARLQAEQPVSSPLPAYVEPTFSSLEEELAWIGCDCGTKDPNQHPPTCAAAG